jgi:hypothetical protein
VELVALPQSLRNIALGMRPIKHFWQDEEDLQDGHREYWMGSGLIFCKGLPLPELIVFILLILLILSKLIPDFSACILPGSFKTRSHHDLCITQNREL